MGAKTKTRDNPLAVRIDKSDLEWLQTERENTGVAVNAMIAKAVAQYVKQRKGVRARRAA